MLTGAFGAHGLRDRLDPGALALWETASRYQMYHGLALLGSSPVFLERSSRLLAVVRPLFLIGVLLFSGSLYALALTGRTSLGAITPVGGAALLAGWACLVLGLLRSGVPDDPSA